MPHVAVGSRINEEGCWETVCEYKKTAEEIAQEKRFEKEKKMIAFTLGDLIAPLSLIIVWWLLYGEECWLKIQQVFTSFWKTNTPGMREEFGNYLLDPQTWNSGYLIFYACFQYLIFVVLVFHVLKEKNRSTYWVLTRALRLVIHITLFIDIFLIGNLFGNHIPYRQGAFHKLLPFWPQLSELIYYAVPVYEVVVGVIGFILVLISFLHSLNHWRGWLKSGLVLLDSSAFWLFVMVAYVKNWRDLETISVAGSAVCLLENCIILSVLDSYYDGSHGFDKFAMKFALVIFYIAVGIAGVGYYTSHIVFWLTH